jgi:DNA-binding NarL/FixJ family response regulator
VAQVLVADGEATVRRFVASTLTRVGFDVRDFACASPLLAAALAERPAAVVVEVELPDVSGYEVCRELQDVHGAGLPVVLVSGRRAEPIDRVAGLLIGAHEYLTKPLLADELSIRVRRLVQPRQHLHWGPDGDSPLGRLTKRERQVLMLLAAGRRQNDIAEELVISPKTTGTHIQRILEKLGVHSRTEAVAMAHAAQAPHR